MRVDIMVDIETLGTEVDSTIFQISAVAFDIESGDKIGEFDGLADISKNEDYEMDVSGKTLKWWLNTDVELFKRLINSGEKSSDEILTDFHKWLEGYSQIGELYLWGNGIMFDNRMIKEKMEGLGLEYPVHFRNDRDVRTIFELAAMKKNMSVSEFRETYSLPDTELEKHNALHDCYNQIYLVSTCYDILVNSRNF